MILPKKQLSVEESLWGFGGFLLQKLQKPVHADELWEYYKEVYSNCKYSVRFSFDQFVMALDYLYIIGAIKKDERGRISYETNQPDCE